jgi:RNA polymerase sigma-70 factor, ECF subfamily
MNPDDVPALVAAAQAGSSEAFSTLHRRYVALVHGILVSRFRPAVAEELTQECFMTAFRKIGQLRDRAKFGAWIATIARRMEATTERVEYAGQLEESACAGGKSGHDPESFADAARVLAVIRELPEAYRESLVLRLVEGMSGAEIAATLQMHPDSVRVNLHRGMKKLREALAIDVGAAQGEGALR